MSFSVTWIQCIKNLLYTISIFQPMKQRVEAALKYVSHYELNLYAQPLLSTTPPDTTTGDMMSIDRPRGRHCVAVVTSPRLRDEERSLSVAAFLELPLFPLVDNLIETGTLSYNQNVFMLLF